MRVFVLCAWVVMLPATEPSEKGFSLRVKRRSKHMSQHGVSSFRVLSELVQRSNNNMSDVAARSARQFNGRAYFAEISVGSANAGKGQTFGVDLVMVQG